MSFLPGQLTLLVHRRLPLLSPGGSGTPDFFRGAVGGGVREST